MTMMMVVSMLASMKSPYVKKPDNELPGWFWNSRPYSARRMNLKAAIAMITPRTMPATSTPSA